MMVVIDTNVLVSAILKDKTPEKVILFIVGHPDMEWIVSDKILREYNQVLSRPKFNLDRYILDQWLSIINKSTTCIESNVKIKLPRDQKDAPFLECSLASNADYFVTGDRDFEGAQKLVNTKILSISQFEKLVLRLRDF
jgi:uncharacterized protein